MAPVGARSWMLLAGLLAAVLLLAGVGQLVCGLYLLLKAPRPAVNGATIAAGLWDVLAGLVSVMLCFSGPLHASRRSQLQLAAFCSAPVVNAALGVLLGLAPSPQQATDVALVCLILAVSTAVAAAASFIAGNVVFCMQLAYEQYRPGTRTWQSPKSTSSGTSSFMFSQSQMTQKPGAPDLWLTTPAPLASWVYRTQSSVETARCETPLDAPPPPPPPPPAAPPSRSSCASLSVRTAQRSEPGSGSSQLPRCLSLLSAIYGPSRGGWPPTEPRPVRSCSLLEVRPSPAPTLTECSSPARPFPPAPVPLCASPLPTPVSERPPPQTPLAGTIGRLTSALSRLHSDPNYRASRELQEALEALEALQVTPGPGDRPQPAGAASPAVSSGYGSPEGAPEPEQPERRSVVQLVSLLEAGPVGRRADTPLRRPTVPPPPPPGAGDRPAEPSEQPSPASPKPAAESVTGKAPGPPVVIDSDC
ncbi:formin-like protein 5 [Amphibalanus amphitrite]|uniref:formin-like protein 5 n=1 Tax=Amphibalanus amphitrite TaxID=1232801 RepID=UPI001C92093D|nr:formin-like protein 5 [Amphibalanus amphitrite]